MNDYVWDGNWQGPDDPESFYVIIDLWEDRPLEPHEVCDMLRELNDLREQVRRIDERINPTQTGGTA